MTENNAELGLEAFAVREHRSLWRDAWRRLISNNTARAGMVIVVILVLATVLSHFFWTYDPTTDLDYSLKLKPPNLVRTEEIDSLHPFGTDKLGRDVFRRVIHGGWNSLRVGLVSVSVSLVIGGLLGLVAGFYESIRIGTLGQAMILTSIGLVLGALPAWIAFQSFQALLFAGLGITAAILAHWQWDHHSGKVGPLRLLAFAGAGLLLGGGPALLTSPYTAIVCAVLGAIIGLVLALPLSGSFISTVIMRAMDIILAFPSILLAIAIVAFLGPGLDKAMIAIGFISIPTFARLVRSQVLAVIQQEYVTAAQAVGAGEARILLIHILPNTLSPIIVQATMGLASAIIWAGALGFLGLGAIPPEPEWGAMLGDSYKFLTTGAWWAVVFPGLAIMLSVLGFNLLGDGLRDALDPKLRL
ncbi:MAG: ABC transporter permease [Chloroflexia bacterium]|nr:ABC transporter permease [Chloroflexia bacterium]